MTYETLDLKADFTVGVEPLQLTCSEEDQVNTIIRTAYEAALHLAVFSVSQTESQWASSVTKWADRDGSQRRGRPLALWTDEVRKFEGKE